VSKRRPYAIRARISHKTAQLTDIDMKQEFSSSLSKQKTRGQLTALNSKKEASSQLETGDTISAQITALDKKQEVSSQL